MTNWEKICRVTPQTCQIWNKRLPFRYSKHHEINETRTKYIFRKPQIKISESSILKIHYTILFFGQKVHPHSLINAWGLKRKLCLKMELFGCWDALSNDHIGYSYYILLSLICSQLKKHLSNFKKKKKNLWT